MTKNLDQADPEFRELATIDAGDSGYPQEYDVMHPRGRNSPSQMTSWKNSSKAMGRNCGR